MLTKIRKLKVSPSRLTALALLAVVAITLLNACGGGGGGGDDTPPPPPPPPPLDNDDYADSGRHARGVDLHFGRFRRNQWMLHPISATRKTTP